MVLAVDIGNTTVAFALFSAVETEPIFVGRMASDRRMTPQGYADGIREILEQNRIDPAHIEAAVLSSVVPPLTDVLCDAVSRTAGVSTIVVNAQTDTGLMIKNYDVTTLGSDRIVDAVAAMAQWQPPLVVVDLGTAATVSVVDSAGCFVGGMIMPGPRLCIEALGSQTAQLPQVDIEQTIPSGVIGQDTTACLRNGAVIGMAAAIDGLITRIEGELGVSVTVVATGGHCDRILPWCTTPVRYDRHLLFKGLYQIYCRHRLPER